MLYRHVPIPFPIPFTTPIPHPRPTTAQALLVYDVSSRQSFEALDAWMDEAYKFGVSESAVFVVCANKMDKGQFTVPTVEGQMWAESRGFEFFETSAADGTNVDAVFEHIFSCLVKD